MIYSYSKTVRQGLLTLAALRYFGVPFMDPELPGGLTGSRKVMNRGWVRLSSQPLITAPTPIKTAYQHRHPSNWFLVLGC
ncbi:MAG: hypothetical protein OEX02_04420 [Cyclobacteriaceae bacterium]|nr:hypothetical protein [Cyclobacteriaceae bacterium]